METGHLIAFNLTLLAALISPGPAMLLSLKTTLSSGTFAGIMTGLGLGMMAAIWTAMALLGLDGLFTLFPWAYLALKTAGALYLIYIAYGMWRNAHAPLTSAINGAPSRWRAFFKGFAVNLSNPKSVVFAASVLMVIFPQNMSFADKALIVFNHLAIEWIAYTGFALALSTGWIRSKYLHLKPLFDRIAAIILAALGGKLILEDIRD